MKSSYHVAIALIVVSIIILGLCDTGSACSCVPKPYPRIEFERVDAVFSGYVIEVVRTIPYAEDVFVTFEVLDSWKGIDQKSVTVSTGWGDSDCGYPFKAGESYLVYAYRSTSGVLRTGICSRTRPLLGAEEDFRELGLGSFPPSFPVYPPPFVKPFQTASDADFDANGEVDFTDFLEFSQAFRSSRERNDLDGNGIVDFSDFLTFARLFGQKAGSGRTITVDLPGNTTLEMVWIEAGTFLMGTTDEQRAFWEAMGAWHEWRADEQPAHPVAISRGFYLGKYEVTQRQWEAVMGTRPWADGQYVQENPEHPAVYISWHDAQAFIHRLNEAAGDSLYRLPTEAEWEYACRAKTTTPWWFGDDVNRLGEYAWYRANSGDKGEKYAHKVGTKKPNPWGLYDMLGNVFEWVQDRYSNEIYSLSIRTRVDPSGPSWHGFSERIARGDCFSGTPEHVRSNSRIFHLSPHIQDSVLGFRLLRRVD